MRASRRLAIALLEAIAFVTGVGSEQVHRQHPSASMHELDLGPFKEPF